MRPLIDRYTYRVAYSPEDDEFVGLCVEFHSLSWLADSPEAALKGIRQVIDQTVKDMQVEGCEVPVPLIDREYSGRFQVRMPPELHRRLALVAAEQSVSLNRLVVSRLQ